MDGFEWQTLNPEVVKGFTGNHRVMREGSSPSVFDKVAEKFDSILRKVKSIEFFMIVMPWQADDPERCPPLFGIF